MTVLAVDLAAKYSAAVLMDDNYTVLNQFDSWQREEGRFIWEVADTYLDGDALIIEDLPHKLPYTTTLKKVLRLQGRIFHACWFNNKYAEGDIIFLGPADWKRTYPGLERGTPPEAVVGVAMACGYEPPDLMERAKGIKGGKAIARKVVTDYCSAYLIARWAITTFKEQGTYDVVGTSRYYTDVIRKKDVNAESSDSVENS